MASLQLTRIVRIAWMATLLLMPGALCANSVQPFSATEIYRLASSAVVMVTAELSPGTFSTATGTVISPQGHILTNHHVVSHDTSESRPTVHVFFKPTTLSGDAERDLREAVPAQVISRDPTLDLAVVRVLTPLPAHVSPIAFGDSESVEIGASVAAIGHPGGGGLWTLTTGTISSARLDGDIHVFQTDAAFNPGSSGGPLLDADARLIGINTYVVRLDANDLPLEGLNYSVRSHFVQDWLEAEGIPIRVPGHAESLDEPPRHAAPYESVAKGANEAFEEIDALSR